MRADVRYPRRECPLDEDRSEMRRRDQRDGAGHDETVTAGGTDAMKKTLKKTRKLALTVETLRALGDAELRQAGGGSASDLVNGTTCYPNFCDVDSNPCQ
jgi:hypothetical protein